MSTVKKINKQRCLSCGASMDHLRVDALYCGKRCKMAATKKRIKQRKGLFTKGAKRECLECGSAFTPIFQRNAYCSDHCCRTSYKRRTAVKRVRECVICGKQFTPNSSMHSMCSDECRRVRDRHSRLARTYGFTPDAFEAMFDKQGNQCAICHTKNASQWAIDHDHASDNLPHGKRVRGILCYQCNQALGLFKDSPDVMSRAIEYVIHAKT